MLVFLLMLVKLTVFRHLLPTTACTTGQITVDAIDSETRIIFQIALAVTVVIPATFSPGITPLLPVYI